MSTGRRVCKSSETLLVTVPDKREEELTWMPEVSRMSVHFGIEWIEMIVGGAAKIPMRWAKRTSVATKKKLPAFRKASPVLYC